MRGLTSYRKCILFTRAFVCLLLLSAAPCLAAAQPPDGFVRVTDAAPDVLLEIRYYSTYNFVGARVDGYRSPMAILSEPAALALKKASDAATARGYVLKIFDAYRPQAAVDHFVRWAKAQADVKMKASFYPDVDKSQLFKLGYIASKSGHSRGSTVDLTLVDRLTGKELDMGSPFDFFGPVSHHGSALVSPEQAANRADLQDIMQASGFKPYSAEWWHYTLANEPHPQTYFDFVVE